MAHKEQELIRRLHEAVNRSVGDRMKRDRRIKDLERENAELRTRLHALLVVPGPAKRAPLSRS
jgi:hypothetical protein